MSARKKNRAIAYLRRSSGRQEASLETQLDWALRTAEKYEISLHGSHDALAQMLAAGQCESGDIFVDDGITGADLSRPGLTRLRQSALNDRRVSHLFVYMSDRLARPENGMVAALMESELCRAGITIVFTDRVSGPRERGVNYFPEDIRLLFDYTESGEFLNKLATRVLESKNRLAEKGLWTGGLKIAGPGWHCDFIQHVSTSLENGLEPFGCW